MKKYFYKRKHVIDFLFKISCSFLLLISFCNTTILAQNCSSIQLSENNNQLSINGLNAPIVIVDVYDPSWSPVFDCGGRGCGTQLLVPNLENGVHHLIIKLFDTNWNQICEFNEDFTMTGITTGNQSDITVSNFQNLPSTAKIGEVETFNFDLTNMGNGTANGAYQVDIYLSANQNLDINQYTGGTPFVKVGEVNTGNTPIGTIGDVVGAINVPNGTALGPYYLVLIADGTEVIAESNESNNVLISDQIITVSGAGNTGGGNTVQCGEITINYGNGSIEMVGNNSNSYFFKIHDLNANWAEVFSCAYQCGSSQTATGLANGDYLVRAYNSSWGQICEQVINLTEGGGSGGEGCGSFEDKFTYQATSIRATANFTEDATGYQGVFKTSENEFIQVNYGFNGEKLSTNFVGINEPAGTFTYSGKDYYYAYSRQDGVVTLNKKNLSGGIIWSKNYTLNNSDSKDATTTFDFKEMDNNLLLIVMYSIPQTLNRRQVIIRTDLSGNENWQREIPLVTNAGILSIKGGAQDGSAYLATSRIDNFVEIVKLDNTGAEQWRKTFANIFQIDDVLFVGESADGNASYFYYLREYEVPVSLMKVNSGNGNTLWNKDLPALFSPNKNIRVSFKRGAVLTSDGGIVASYYYNSFGTSAGAEYGKLDANGNFLWRQEIAAPRETPYTPALGTTDGGVIFWDAQVNVMLGVAKVTADGTFDPTCSGNTGGGGETIQCGKIAINYEGATINMQGQSGNNYFFKIYDLTDNWKEVFSCSYSCGSSQTATIDRNGAYLVRAYNDSWEQICEQEIRLDDAGQRSSLAVRTFSIFPNPAQEEITLDLNEYAGENAELFISNMYGQVVQQKRIENIPFEAVKLPLTNFVNGFYFVHVKLENRRLRSEKFLVKRLY